MGGHNELRNRYMPVNLPPETAEEHTPASTRRAAGTYPASAKEADMLIEVLAEQQLSIKEMPAATRLKDRGNLMANYLNPAIKKGSAAMPLFNGYNIETKGLDMNDDVIMRGGRLHYLEAAKE